jgi:hypothetical protein
MNRSILASITICILLILTACEKEVSDKLKGKWQLKTIEEAGRTTPVDTVWYNFQSESIFMYQIYHPAVDTFSWTYGFKTQPDKHIIHLELINWTILKEDFLLFTDWEATERTFTVDKVNCNLLILKSDNKTYTNNRY